MIRYLVAAAAAVLLMASIEVRAVEALDTNELVSHCIHYEADPDSKDGIFCVRYIQGFIDGAVATDERVTFSVADEYDKDESFTERAIRTRVGNRIQRYGPSYYAGFCLGEPLPLKTVVERVIEDLMDAQKVRNLPLARELVYATLVSEFPCEAPDDE